MKKTWVKIKRGLIEPKHRTALGIRIWLYLYILDQSDWEQGAVIEWKDKNASDELCMPIDTVRSQRRKLEEDKYITCHQGKHSQTIEVKNWTNPREYSGEVHNKGVELLQPSEKVKGGNKGCNKVIAKVNTPTSKSHITNHIQKKKSPKPKDNRSKHKAIMAVREVTGKFPRKTRWDDLILFLGDDPDVPKLRACWKEWDNRGYNQSAVNWIFHWYKNGIPGKFEKKITKKRTTMTVNDRKIPIWLFSNGKTEIIENEQEV